MPNFVSPQTKNHSLSSAETETGYYQLVHFIRSDRKLNIFGETFSLAPELQHEYMVATVDVKEQKMKIFLEHAQVDEFSCKLR